MLYRYRRQEFATNYVYLRRQFLVPEIRFLTTALYPQPLPPPTNYRSLIAVFKRPSAGNQSEKKHHFPVNSRSWYEGALALQDRKKRQIVLISFAIVA